MRVHANFAEYTPLALILLFFLETETEAAGWILHTLGIGLLIGRSVHALGVSRVKEDYRFRVTGMAMTFGVIVASSLRLLLTYARQFLG